MSGNDSCYTASYSQEEICKVSRKQKEYEQLCLLLKYVLFSPPSFLLSLSSFALTPTLSAMKTLNLYRGPACASWLEKDKTHRKASWLLRLGLYWQNTTNPWRRLRPLINCRSTFDAWFIYEKGTTQSPFMLLCCGVCQEVLLCKQTLFSLT